MIKENKKMFDMTNVSLWQEDNLGEGTTIVILDEGHQDNHFKYLRGKLEVPITYKENSREHGAITVAVGYQIAPNARVIYMDFNSANNDTREKMIEWVVKHRNEIDIINVSLDFRKSITDRYFPQLESTGIPIVCASGNDSYEDKIAYPARYPYTIAVGAYSPNGGGNTYYSNGGRELDCIADAGTYYPSTSGKPISQFGTSFSSPNVAYSLLLYFSWRKKNKLPKLSVDEVRQLIKDNAKDLYEEGHDFKSGYGLFRLPNEIPIINGGVEVAKEYTDVLKTRWSYDNIQLVTEKGIMNGYGDGSFKPIATVTREEVATMFANLLRNK